MGGDGERGEGVGGEGTGDSAGDVGWEMVLLPFISVGSVLASAGVVSGVMFVVGGVVGVKMGEGVTFLGGVSGWGGGVSSAVTGVGTDFWTGIGAGV